MDFVEQLKSSVDIVNVVGEYVKLRRSGANRYMGLCPFHSEKTASFTVHAVHQFYCCFSCGASERGHRPGSKDNFANRVVAQVGHHEIARAVDRYALRGVESRCRPGPVVAARSSRCAC